MAMDSDTRAEAYRSALAAIRARGDSADVGGIAQDVWARFGLTTGVSYLEFVTLVRSAERDYLAAREMQADPSYTPAGRDLPVDPTADPSEGRYQYRVVVVSTDARRNVEESLVVVSSDSPLSGEEARSIAEHQVQSGLTARSTNPRDGFDSASATVTSYIVSAGRSR